MKNRFYFLLIILFANCGSNEHNNNAPGNTDQEANAAGKDLFYAKCAGCHMVNKELTGPPLKGVEDRWPDKQKLYGFIRNSQEAIKTDRYAHELWLKYNQTMMNPYPDMTDDNIRSILDYINSASEE